MIQRHTSSDLRVEIQLRCLEAARTGQSSHKNWVIAQSRIGIAARHAHRGRKKSPSTSMLTLHSIIDASSRAKVLFYGSFSLNRVFLTVGSRMLSNGRTKAWQGTHRRSCMPNKTLMSSSLLGPLCAIAKKSAVSPSNCPVLTWDSFAPINWHFLLL